MIRKQDKSGRVNYELAGGRINYDDNYVSLHTKIPENPEDTPRIIGWSGPARSGTTALLFLLASHPSIDRAYFQPQKTLMRLGGPDFVLRSRDKIVCMKEVFGSLYTAENYDPIKNLLLAGIPAEKITWILLLRDPAQTFASWHARIPEITPQLLAQSQRHTVALYNKYKDTKVRIIPLVYELFQGQERAILAALMMDLGIEADEFTTEFDLKTIDKKLVKGQAASEAYFDQNLRSILERNKFVYSRRPDDPSKDLTGEVERLCRRGYEDFVHLTNQEVDSWNTERASDGARRLEFVSIHGING